METIHVVCFKNRISKFFCDTARKQSANSYEIHRKRFAEGLQSNSQTHLQKNKETFRG